MRFALWFAKKLDYSFSRALSRSRSFSEVCSYSPLLSQGCYHHIFLPFSSLSSLLSSLFSLTYPSSSSSPSLSPWFTLSSFLLSLLSSSLLFSLSLCYPSLPVNRNPQLLPYFQYILALSLHSQMSSGCRCRQYPANCTPE